MVTDEATGRAAAEIGPRPHRAPTSTRIGAVARKLLWRFVTYLAGGLTVTGRPPTGPGIVVANHTSHADTAIMFASLPARSRPFAVAAGDYWYSGWAKRLAARTVVATVPVSRSGAGDAYGDLLTAIRPRLDAGGLVILYPEGTRTTDGDIGEFKPGATRLASDLGVPLYPAAIKGVRRVLPKGGRITYHPMEIVFGDPVHVPPDADRDTVARHTRELRDHVDDLKADDRPAAPVSRRYARTVALVSSSALWTAAFVWGFAEALFWPLIAEAFIAFAVIVRPARVLPAAAVLALGSATGVCLHAYLAFNGVEVWRPLTTERMYAQATSDITTAGGQPYYYGIWHQLLSGIPVKEYGAAAGELARARGQAPDYQQLFWWTLVWRSARIMVAGVVIAVLGIALRRVLVRWYPIMWWTGFVLFAIILGTVYQGWR